VNGKSVLELGRYSEYNSGGEAKKVNEKMMPFCERIVIWSVWMTIIYCVAEFGALTSLCLQNL